MAPQGAILKETNSMVYRFRTNLAYLSMDAQKAFREVVVVLTPQAAVRPKRSLEPESDVITTPLSVMNS
ncbi:MAG: hypothetical protein N839_0014190 [Desulfofustis sp. PB-SRB1]|jgi:hypothetical protein|nr:hypothetical protein [Desulfofustis sp. PB-SRB1]MBM1003543.1 hypothetical protein [Desulfofustis sp. PB-SRB1]HBH28577.1 hypothetical protein [Desulfofustis sp.]